MALKYERSFIEVGTSAIGFVLFSLECIRLCLGLSGCLVCHLFCSLVFSFWVKLLLLVVFFRVEFGVDSFWMLVFFFGLVVFVLFSWQLLLFLPFLV